MKIGAHIIAMFILCAVKSVVKHVKSEVVALSKYIESEVAYELARTNEYYSDFRRSIADLTSLKELLDDTPASDVVEVRHGKIKWVNRPIAAQYATVTNENGEKHYGKVCDRIENNPVGYCGECGKRLDDTFMNFCPNCGAKMDGENNEAD